MKPIRIQPRYVMILNYDIRQGMQEQYYRYLNREFLPVLQQRKVYMQDAWVLMYGDKPERRVELVTEHLENMRDLLRDPQWDELERKLKGYTTNYTRRITRYTSNFKI